MPDYRIYKLADDGKISWAPEIVNCANDDLVVQHATNSLDGHQLQVWDGPRLVIILKPQHASLWSASSYEPDVLKAMDQAYDIVLEDLQKNGQTRIGEEALALRIMEMAKNGERNPDRMARLILEGHA